MYSNPLNLKRQPQIGMTHVHRENGTRLIWSIYANTPFKSYDYSYELRVTIDGTGREMRLYLINRAEHDDIELLTPEAFKQRLLDVCENEPKACEQHTAESVRAVEEPDEECLACKEASMNYAYAALADKCRPAEKVELALGEHMTDLWKAFELLFNPAWTL
jgi:hypothetical protein